MHYDILEKQFKHGGGSIVVVNSDARHEPGIAINKCVNNETPATQTCSRESDRGQKLSETTCRAAHRDGTESSGRLHDMAGGQWDGWSTTRAAHERDCTSPGCEK